MKFHRLKSLDGDGVGWFAVAIVGVVLSPYTTVGLEFHRGLVVQAVLILLFTSLPIATGWRRLPSALRGAPWRVLAGMALYGMAALLGAGTGVVRGNSPALVAGQLLSMLLLPWGYLAALAVEGGERRRIFSWSLVGAVATASLIHLGYWGYRWALGQPQLRMYLPNRVSAAGVLLVALLAAIGLLLGAQSWRQRAVGAPVALLLAAYLVGTGTRSLWAAGVIGVAVLVLLEVALGPPSKAVWATLAAGLSLTVMGGLLVAVSPRFPRVDVLPQQAFKSPFWISPQGGTLVSSHADGTAKLVIPSAPESKRRWTRLSHQTVVDESWPLLASVDGNGVGNGRAAIVFFFGSSSGDVGRAVKLPLTSGTGWQRTTRVVFERPRGAAVVWVALKRDPSESARWQIRRVRLEQYRHVMPLPLLRQLLYVHSRVSSLFAPLGTAGSHVLSSRDFRLHESRWLWREFRRGPFVQKMVGRGLGARTGFRAQGHDALGRQVEIVEPSYIHNFYGFLLYKLGLLGGALVLLAIACWMTWAVRELGIARRSPNVHPLVVFLACWAAYLAWSVVSPEIIDYRVAPILGFLGILSFGEAGGSPDETEGELADRRV